MSQYAFFKDINNLSMGSVTIKTGPDHSQTTTNINPYTNYGQHASGGGRIDNYGEGRRAVSAQDIDPPRMVPDSRPSTERVKSAPAVIESQPPTLQPLRQLSPDATPSEVKAPSDTFAELWSVALEKYKEKTGVDIQDRKNEFVQLFDDCEDSGGALAVLAGLPTFKKPGARTTWVKIKDSLKKVLDVVIVLNTIAAEAGNAAVPHFGKMIFVGTGLLLKATKDITKQTDALEKLFSRLAAFLSRLEVRGKARIQPSSKRIIIKILVELLNSLAIATVLVKGKFWTKVKSLSKKLLFDEDEIEKALSRLSDLTEEESAMVLAELAASRPDFEELVKEVGGLDADVRGLALQLRSVIGIGNLDNEELKKLCSILQSTKVDDKMEVIQILQLLKIENDGTQTAVKRIETEVQELRRSLADRSIANGQAGHETSENGDRSAGGMQDTYDTYANYGQHVTGGDVTIRGPQMTAPPVNLGSRQPERPALTSAGSSRDMYGSYSNYGQHVTGGTVIITKPKTNVRQ